MVSAVGDPDLSWSSPPSRAARYLRFGLYLTVAAMGAFALVSCGSSRAPRRPGPSRPGGPSLATGWDADPLFFGYPPRLVTTAWFKRMQKLDSTWVRIGAYWADIAPLDPPPGFRATDPGDPHYNWKYLDTAVRAAAAAHQHVLLTIGWPPVWALGLRPPRSVYPGTWRPNALAYGRFARAVVERYSGRFPDPADPARVMQAAENLLDNALRYAPAEK